MRALIPARKSNKVDTASGEGIGLDTQDERAREFCGRLGIEVIDTARDVISGRVAPIDRKELGAWLRDPAKLALFDCIVAYRTDRLSRGEDTDWSRIETWAADAGKTLIIVDSATGIRYPARDDSDYWQWQAAKRQSGREWNDIRERVVRSVCRIMRDGGWVGRAPFGYEITGEKYRKALTPGPHADLVPEIFRRVIAGQSLRSIAAWLTLSGIPTERGRSTWHDGSIRDVLRNQTYTGQHSRHCAECGELHALAAPALVDMATQARALAALKSRQRGVVKAGGRPSMSPAMLIPVCDSCGTAMYRGSQGRYYQCVKRTHMDARTGCGLTVPLARVDAYVNAVMAKDARPETVRKVTYPAAELESRVEFLRRAERAAFELDDDDAMMTARRERRAAEALLGTTPRETVIDAPTGRTRAEAWSELDNAGKRAWIRSQGIEVRLSHDGCRVAVPREVA